MSHMSSRLCVLSLFIALAVPVSGQVRSRVEPLAKGVWSGRPLVTAMVSRDQLRLTALALTRSIRLEVLSQAGEPVYDSRFLPGNRLEWQVKDQQGAALRDGIYGCFVTVEDLEGQISHRQSIFQVINGTLSFHTTNLETAASASDEQGNLTILPAEDPSPFTLVSHDGKEGWIESAGGGLSFYTGSLSRSRDAVPQLRLTPEGNVGIGVAEPQAKLDVAGVIRASEGFQLADGTVLRMEGGLPVLVSELNRTEGSPTGSAGKTARVLAAGGNVGVALAGNGSSGKVFGSEGGAPLYNTFYGLTAGAVTTGGYNSFFGYAAGSADTNSGGSNTFVGAYAGSANTSGSSNAFVGAGAGITNTSGYSNSFVGAGAGNNNTTGRDNSFFGTLAGAANSTAWQNSFFGSGAGAANTTANSNSFFGWWAGYANTTGSINSFFGSGAGAANTTAYANSFFGSGAGWSNTTGYGNAFFGQGTGFVNTTASGNSFFGYRAGYSNTTGNDNLMFGHLAGLSNTVEHNNSFIGSFSNGAAGITSATAIGYQSLVTQSNSLVLGSINGVNGATADTKVGIGTTAPVSHLNVTSASTASPRGITNEQYNNGMDGVQFRGRKARGIPAAPGAIQSGDVLGNYVFDGHDGSAFGTGVQIRPVAEENWSTTAHGAYLALWTTPPGSTTNTEKMRITGSGKVGIGTTNPGYQLEVSGGDVKISNSLFFGMNGDSTIWGNGQLNIKGTGTVNNILIGTTVSPSTWPNSKVLYVQDGSGNDTFDVLNSGNVGIGTTTPTERLQVVGNIKISGAYLQGAPEEPVPDYVFEQDYRLMPIEELQKYVQQEKHLPNIPDAAQIKEKGLNLGEFQMRLLEKIEELTLYTVTQADAIRTQKEEHRTAIERKDAEIAALSARLAALERIMDRLARQEQK